MKKQAGITLSEVLISLFLSSFLVTLLMQFYLTTKQQYSKAEEKLATSFDVRWVSELLSDSIRRAGFTPCLSLDQLEPKDRRQKGKIIHGLFIEKLPEPVIQVNRMSEYFVKVNKILNSTQLLLPYTVSFNLKRPLLIASCAQAEVQQIFDLKPHPEGVVLTLEKPLHSSYTSATYVGEFIEERWFIKLNKQGKKSLYYQSSQTEELSPAIHSLQANILSIHDKSFIEILLGIAEDQIHSIKIMIRGS